MRGVLLNSSHLSTPNIMTRFLITPGCFPMATAMCKGWGYSSVLWKERQGHRKMYRREPQTHFLLRVLLTFQRYECWVSFQLGQCLAPQLLHFVVPLLLVPVPSATMTASQLLACVQQMRFCLDSLVAPLPYRPLALLHHSGMLQALNNSPIHS